MTRKGIDIYVERKLYAESMGRCMNPKCRRKLWRKNGDVIEKAHIDPYCKTEDNSFENLVVLCPTCHKDFDKNSVFTPEEVSKWKEIRKKELEKFFSKKYSNFNELEKEAKPLLLENKSIYENYYLAGEKELWNMFEGKIIANNRTLKLMFENNMNLFQVNSCKEDSNRNIIREFINHVNEFEETRSRNEKNRKVLFPKGICSIFGIEPSKENILPFTESLEILVSKLIKEGKEVKAVLDVKNPYISIKEKNSYSNVFLDDAPRLRQLYYEYDCFRKVEVRLESLLFVLRYIKSKKIKYTFEKEDIFRVILINNRKIRFIYKYCLSEADLKQLLPEENSIIVNLHNWNGEASISEKAHEFAKIINVELLTMEGFYDYVNKLKTNTDINKQTFEYIY